MKKVAIMIAIILISFFNIIYPNNTDTLSVETFNAVKQADNVRNLELYQKARALCERQLLINPESNIASYHLAYCSFRISYTYLSDKDLTNFNKYMDEAIKLLKGNIEKNEMDAESIALLSTCYGIKISADYSLGQSLGEQCMILISKANGIAPENPRVMIADGIVKFNFPDFFGGDKAKASELFKNSIETFKSIKNDKYAWGLSDAYAWYLTSLITLDNHDEAKKVVKEALEYNTEFGWIKYGILPKIKNYNN
jgi:tetratricopeptide (TPR) repeat protein